MPKRINFTETELINAIKTSNSFRSTAQKLGFRECPHRLRKLIVEKIKELNINRDHWLLSSKISGNQTWEPERLTSIIKESFSIAEILRKLQLKTCGGNYFTINKFIQENKLDTSHFSGQAHLKGKTHNWNAHYSLEEILTENSYYQTSKLRERLLKAEIFQNNCAICGITGWLDKPLVLHLDHINGIRTDNRIRKSPLAMS